MTITLRRRSLLGATLTAALAAPALAQGYPSRPVRLIVPYPPGGATDITARLLAQELSSALGQPFAVENRGGGASVTGTQAIAAATPDGHALGVIDTAFVVNPGLLGSRLPYDTRQDFSFVSVLVRSPLVLVVPASAPWPDLAALVRDAKARPNELTFGSAGNGTAVHMAGEQFRLAAGFSFVHVPYRGGGPMITDVLAGRVQMAFGTIPAMAEHVRAGRLRALAITGATRASLLPEVPTMAEAGFPAVDAALLNALIGPAGLPEPVLAQLAEASRRAVTSPAMTARLTQLGFEPVGGTPAEAAALLLAQITQWDRVIRDGDIKVD